MTRWISSSLFRSSAVPPSPDVTPSGSLLVILKSQQTQVVAIAIGQAKATPYGATSTSITVC